MAFPFAFRSWLVYSRLKFLLELLTFLACGSLSFSLARLIFSREVSRGRIAGALASVFCPDRLELSYLSPLQEDPS